ncbi:hypothetical protein ABIE44_000962 [Marmoricola sp. OAE513]|uniref:hypothetical protein n=1 Tax=Marmoricola sp. OAE513 TaxID=2817894 RepID=UPI001AE768BF
MNKRPIQAMLVVAILLDIVYWTLWFAERDWIASEKNQAYYEFENAFPLADFWLGLACLLALITLQRNRPSALLWLLCAGSAGLYLFGMDFLYDVENGIFTKGGGGAFEAVIVALTLFFSVTILTWAWRHRGELLSGDASSPV